MIKLDNINALRLGLSIFFFIILTGVFFYKFLPAKYSVSVKHLSENNYLEKSVSPYAFIKIQESNNSDFLLVDIRDESSFSQGHFENAVNMPLKDILLKKNLKKLRKQKNYIISDNEQITHITTLLLNQLGADAIAVNSDYAFIKHNLIESFNHKYIFFSSEKKAYDYQRFLPFRKTIEIEEKALDVSELGGC